jgi:hypothetical protein
MSTDETKLPKSRTWLIVLLICGFVFGYGALAFISIGSRPPADWDFGGVNDVPGGSAYSTKTNSTAYLKKSPITTFLMWLSVDFERMRITDVQRPYEVAVAEIPAGAVPVDGGEAKYRFAPTGTIVNPIDLSTRGAYVSSLKKGADAFVYFCIQCHGTYLNGDGTVGQSFQPLPTDLQSPGVQARSDDFLFRHLSYGYEFTDPDRKLGKKAPPLYYTVAVADRWHVINFMRSFSQALLRGPASFSGDFATADRAGQLTVKTYDPDVTTTRHPKLGFYADHIKAAADAKFGSD